MIKGVLIDLSGTLHLGNEAIPGAAVVDDIAAAVAEILAQLRRPSP